MKWYSYKPVDTMFFRGAEPLEKGVSHTVSTLFPPPVQTIAGALRTACLRQNGISIRDYYKGNIRSDILETIGPAGEAAPFHVFGPVFRKDRTYYVPAPYSWYYAKGEDAKKDSSVWEISRFYQVKEISSSLIRFPHSVSWVKSAHEELECAGGKWVTLDTLEKRTDSSKLFSLSYFYAVEERTGIALDPATGTVREGHLFSMNHVRLREDVEIVFGVDTDLPLADTGVLSIGGEQRFGRYAEIEPFLIETGDPSCFLTLTPIETTYEGVDLKDAVIASGKIQYIGGWDMKKGFHKEMVGYYPAGTVFNRKIDANCLGLMEDM